jgi:hypothetical protein
VTSGQVVRSPCGGTSHRTGEDTDQQQHANAPLRSGPKLGPGHDLQHDERSHQQDPGVRVVGAEVRGLVLAEPLGAEQPEKRDPPNMTVGSKINAMTVKP